ncbi:protein transport protein Sec24C isoform X2 [Macrosteles quadrilineatus]|uniref:protein transport protein Sec24C isoform X2 n=1 Tax=Macrosteles quadrilineatus TaxID=74068 RepID=UPI0023E18F54|nr:protein transport protein Sec24C isoform X2 [Macrosteles quadrilineatus]
MNPQYMSQPPHPQQLNPQPGYGGYPGPAQGPPQYRPQPPQNGPAQPGGYPPRMPPMQRPPMTQQMPPPSGPQPSSGDGFPHPGPGGHGGPLRGGGMPPGPPPPTGQPLPPQLHSQMAGMSINGPTSPPPQNNFPAPPVKTAAPTSSFPPAVNGTSPPDLISPGYMNGAPQVPGPGRGPMPPPQQGKYPSPTQPSEMYSNSGGYPAVNSYGGPQPGGYPPQPQAQPQPQPGYPGYQTASHPPAPGAYPGPTYPGQQAPQRRLDPDQMPSPLQVMMEDQKSKGGVFYTNQRGQVPPLVTTQFVVQDQGNCSPRFVRSTMYSVPVNVDMMKQTAVPFGLVISPLARQLDEEPPPPIVDMGDLGPVRCIRCKAYMCPFMQFIDGGRRFQCLFCKATTDVPEAYFQHLDHTGQRIDRYERPELVLGSYEFVATKEYCRNDQFPKPPAVIFMIDVSYNNMKSGLVHLLCSQMKDILRNLPREPGQEKSRMRVGFVTYNNSVHFYNVKGCLAQPQMLVVGDTNEMFMPLLDGFLVDPEESEAVIDSLMQQIPDMFAETRETDTILGPVVQAGMEALKAAECAGKLVVFHTSLPTAEAPGKLKNRDDRKLLATEKEKTVLNPQTNFYNNLAQECVGVGCSVDLFVMNNSYIDLATIGQVCRLTGGEIFKYTYFQANIDGDRLIADVKYDIGRPIVFDAIMRVRTSTGVRPTDFFGHFFMSNTTDMELASIDCDKAVALEVKHDDKLTEEEGVFVQVALLHTSCSGQRRIRILNLSLKTCSQMADLYRACELDTIMNFFAKQALFRLRENPPKQVKDSLVQRCAMMLACYRKNCASPSSAGQLILPECMKLLPLYVSCLLKSDAVSGGSDMTIDDRSFAMYAVNIMDIPNSVAYFYPRLIPLHDIDTESSDIPLPIRCSAEKLRDDGAYLLDNGIHMFLWLGLTLAPDWVQAVFGVPTVAQVNTDDTKLPELDNPLSQRIQELIAIVRCERHRFMRLTLVRQRDKMEMVMKHFLVEDRGMDGTASYVDFLCHMHKEIRSILS